MSTSGTRCLTCGARGRTENVETAVEETLALLAVELVNELGRVVRVGLLVPAADTNT